MLATQENMDELKSIIWNGTPLLFHVNAIGFSEKDDFLTNVYATYHYTAEEYAVMMSECEAAADDILDGIIGNESLNDVYKALLIHDRLIVKCEYDYEGAVNNSASMESYEMYGALVKGVALCKGYSYAYMYLLDKVGIESYICSSKNLKHDWNIVYINGKKYHVDLTFDDPVHDVTGRVYHKDFLLSTAALKKADHMETDYDSSPTDTTFDNYYWRNSNTEFQLIGNKLYYIDNEKETLNEVDGSDPLCKVNDVWLTPEGFYWSSNYSRLSSSSEDLFYSIADTVYMYDPETKKSTAIFKPSLSGTNNFAIYGFTYDEGYLVCDLFNKPVFYEDTKSKYQIRTKFDTTPPTAKLQYTNGVQAYQTLTFSFNDDMGISGYYWGTDTVYQNNEFYDTSSKTVTRYISEPGTYYLTVKDTGGNVSETQKVEFCSTTLEANHGHVANPYIVSPYGATVTLPVPVREGYNFLGWTKGAEGNGGYLASVSVNSNAVYYANWEEIEGYVPDSGSTGAKITFEDISQGTWYYDSVIYCAEKKYMNGISSTLFSPATKLTREQFVMILANISGVNTDSYKYASSGMDDVPLGKWYSGAVAWSVKAGLVKGIGDAKFGLGQAITREQIARLLYVYAQSNDKPTAERADLSRFADESSISSWAYKEVQWAVYYGVIRGVSQTMLAPKTIATRAQAAKMFMIYDEIY